MTTPTDFDSIPQTGFDPVAFWVQHKTKVIIYGAVLLLAAAGYGWYEYSTQQTLAESRAAFYQAGSEDDYRQIIQKYPHSVAAGNASLLLAEKLRDEKKYDDAVSVLQAAIAGEPTYPLIDGAWLSLACTYNAQGKPDQAIDTYQQTATKFADRFSAPFALYSVAEIYAAEGKTDQAKTAYENVKSQFPDSYYANVAVQKLGTLGTPKK